MSNVVLVVEDDDIKFGAVRVAARRSGVMITRATCVEDGVRLLNDDRGQLYIGVVSDWSLPDGDGSDVVPVARQHGLPVCVYSGHNRQMEDVEWIETPEVEKLQSFFVRVLAAQLRKEA